ncbi:hypothetical protein [Spongiactinospora sp. 9N601]|uniref:hypothetical protein n=1 Tax=Spongiactinospora sp. 9N601 TaxID=3375149 RepID=UPI0037B397E0
MSGRWWRSEFASLGMPMPAPARERRAVDVLCWGWALWDLGGCVGLARGLRHWSLATVTSSAGQDGLGGAAMGEPALRITQVEVA